MQTRITLAFLALLICLLPALEPASARPTEKPVTAPDVQQTAEPKPDDFTAPVPPTEPPKPSAPQSEAENDASEMDCTRPMKYDWRTQRQLDAYWHQVYMGYVHLIETYAWEGALTQAQKQTRLHYLKTYINTIKKHRYRWCSEHEPDEWEEEWYNSPND